MEIWLNAEIRNGALMFFFSLEAVMNFLLAQRINVE
jgi:hypothetical protein